MMWKFMSEGLDTELCYATAAILMILVIILNILVTLSQKFFQRRKAK